MYLFKENVFIFEWCVMRAVSVPCEFSVVVSGGAGRWQRLVEALSGDVAALSDDVAVKCMLGTACCCYRKGTSLCLQKEQPL